MALFKRDPTRKLKKTYLRLLKEARDLQRAGDIPAFARKTAEAEAVADRMEALRTEQADS